MLLVTVTWASVTGWRCVRQNHISVFDWISRFFLGKHGVLGCNTTLCFSFGQDSVLCSMYFYTTYPSISCQQNILILNVCAPLVFVLFQEKYHKDFLFLRFLIMSGAAAAQLGYLNLPGLDRLKSGPARVEASSLGIVEESNRNPFFSHSEKQL